MNRLLRFLLLAVISSLATPAAAQQSSCTYLTPAGTLRAAGPSDRALPFINQTQCVLGEVRSQLLDMAAAEIACSEATIPASTQQTISLTTAETLAGTETIVPGVEDSTGSVTPVGISSASGTSIVVTAFNRDAGADHTVKVCVQISR